MSAKQKKQKSRITVSLDKAIYAQVVKEAEKNFSSSSAVAERIITTHFKKESNETER